MYIDAFVDTNDVEHLEIYWNNYTDLDAASEASVALFRAPFESAYARWTRTWGVGLGPTALPGEQLSMRRKNATSGQILYCTVWATIEREKNANG